MKWQLNHSVALCTSNGPAHFKKRLHSILTQSFRVQEICFFDDATEDEFRGQILEEMRICQENNPKSIFQTKFNNPTLRVLRSNWTARLLRRVEPLVDWLLSQGFSGADIQLRIAQGKVANQFAGKNYPNSRSQRAIHIFLEIKPGRHQRCGLGIQNIVRDLIQPV